ncbi:MAG TPA: hypothetical protein DD473_01005 [Planctomycetaceae bacterium]|nr:hypothetical protein [Planctomycetaceae bacterium]
MSQPIVTSLTDCDRRRFLATGLTAAAGLVVPNTLSAALFDVNKAAKKMGAVSESAVKDLYSSLDETQRKAIVFDWDYTEKGRGLLRSHVSNNWQITKPEVRSRFFTDEQQDMVRTIFEGIVNPDWHARYYKQIEDDNGGFGDNQSIAIFGNPESDKFEFVMTGRHLTLRCDGNSSDHLAFGGPIFYGHDPLGEFNEGPNHIENVFWDQALEANKVYAMLDGKQRKQAEVARTPGEGAIAFQGSSGRMTGLPVSEMSSDQKEALQKTLQKLVEMYRQIDQDEIAKCLKSQGGLDACSLSFYTDKDIGKDRVWDNWRLEGPAFVWHYRGAPHVHVWVNIADSSDVKSNTPLLQRRS